MPLETLWGSQIVFCDQFQLKPSVAFYNTVVLEAAQEMLLGMCQASTNENFLPATPARAELGASSGEPGRMTDAVAYQGQE